MDSPGVIQAARGIITFAQLTHDNNIAADSKLFAGH